MASEIEQPFRLGFQSDSIHSGSVSFGRFETEALSWERRSSFSHNRYLEEVEKYSRPGSVTEKKAYFEAHFKRRALLSRCASDCQTGVEYQTSENDLSENTGYNEELEQNSESNHSVQFDKSSNSSEYGREIEVTYHERLDMGTPYVETQFKPATDTCSSNVSEIVNEIQSSSVIDGEPRQEVKDHRKDEEANVVSTHKSVDSFTNSCTTTGDVSACTVEEDTGSSELQQESSPQVEIKLRRKPTAPHSKSLVNVSQFRRTSSGGVSKDAEKKHRKTGGEGSRTTTNTKLLSQKAVSVSNSVQGVLKPEDCRSSKLKLVQDKRSVKELKTGKAVCPKPSVVHKVVLEAPQTVADRPMLNEKSSKPGTRSNSFSINSKSSEQPERIREAKKEAELKEHRKCPDLKATPKPSISSEAVARGSGRNKVVSSSNRTSKLVSKPTSVFAATVKPSSDVKAKSCQPTTSSGKPATTGSSRRQTSAAAKQVVSGVSTRPPMTNGGHQNRVEVGGVAKCQIEKAVVSGVSTRPPMTNGGHQNRVEVGGVAKCQKEKAKGSGNSLQKHRLTGKAPRNEESREVDVRRSRAEMFRKDIKGRYMVGVLRAGLSAVDVAS